MKVVVRHNEGKEEKKKVGRNIRKERGGRVEAREERRHSGRKAVKGREKGRE